MNSNNSTAIYRAFDLLRFPLALGVIMIHCNFVQYVPETSIIAAYDHGYTLFQRYILGLMVPTFFAISGFMFFRDGACLSLASYRDKLRRRVTTLLIPYLLWNVIGLVVLAVKQFLLSDTSGQHDLASYSFADLLQGFFMTPGGPYPYDFPLWFIRNLFIICLLSPIISLALRLFKNFTPLLFIAVQISSYLWLPELNRLTIFNSVTFFSLGATLAVSKWRDKILFDASPALLIILFIILVSISIALSPSTLAIDNAPRGLSVVLALASGTIMLMRLAVKAGVANVTISRRLSDSSFFIFAFHGLFCAMVCRMVIRLIPPSSIIICVVDFLVIFIVITAITLAAYALLQLIAPRLLSILTGQRDKRNG